MKGVKFIRQWLPQALVGQKFLVVLVCLLSLGTAICSIGASLIPWVLHQNKLALLGPIGGILLLRACFSVFQDRISETLAYKAMSQLSARVCQGFVHSTYEVRHSLGLAEFLFLFNQTVPKLEMLAREIPKAFFTSIPVLVILLGAGLWLKPLLVLGVVVVLGALIPLWIWMSRDRANAGKKVMELNIKSQKRLRELAGTVGPLWGLGSAEALRHSLVTQDFYLKARKDNHHKLNGVIYASEFAMGFGLIALDRLGLHGVVLVQAVSAFMVFHFGFYALRQLSRLPISLKELEDQIEKLEKLYLTLPPKGEWQGPVSHLSLSGASYQYPQSQEGALKGVTLGLQPGRLVMILGKNGSGKSTLLRLLSGRLSPQVGELRVSGAKIDPDLARVLASHLVYLPQDLSLPESTVADFLEDLAESKVMMLARNMGMMPLMSRLGSSDFPALSRGELQKVMVLKTIFQPAEAYFLDEWDTAMDDSSKKVVLEHLRKMAKEKIVVCVTHDESMLGEDDLVLEMSQGVLLGPATA